MKWNHDLRCHIICTLLMWALPFGEVQAGVTLDGLSGPGAGGPGEIICGQPVTFNLRATNDLGFDVEGFDNGLRIYSPDGASWTPITGTWNPAIDWSGLYFDLILTVNFFSANGSGSDTIGFGAVKLFNPGIPIGFNEVFGLVNTEVSCGELGKTLCLDSSFTPPAGSWVWSVNGGSSVNPSWDGPHCFTIVSSANEAPSLTNNPVNLVFDHCALGTFDFDANDPESDPITFEIVSGPGSIDPNTGAWSWSPSIFDVGNNTLEVRACDAFGCGSTSSVTVSIVNQAPVITSCPETVFLAGGLTGISPPIEATDDDACDDHTFSILGILPFPPMGLISVDPADGSLQFDSDGGDGELQFIVTVEVTDGASSELCDVVFEVLPGVEPESFIYEVVNETAFPVGRLKLDLFNPPGELKIEPENVWISKQLEPCDPPIIPTSPPEISDSIVLDWTWDCIEPGDTVKFLVHAQNGPIHLANAQWSTAGGGAPEPIDRTTVKKTVKRKVTVHEPKLTITANPLKLRLKWNGDQGEAGRNNGEIFAAMTYVLNGEKVERTNIKQREWGPMKETIKIDGKDKKRLMLSSTIIVNPTPPPIYTISPREMKILGSVLQVRFTADCDVKELLIDGMFIEGDDNNDIEAFVEIVKDIWANIRTASWIFNVTIPLERLINRVVEYFAKILVDLTSNVDDPIGKFSTVVALPACPDEKWYDTITVNLDNLISTELWHSAPAEAETPGPAPISKQEFIKYGILVPPNPIGSMDIRVAVKPNGDSSSFIREITVEEIVELNPPDLYSGDLGQLDDGVINGTFNIAGLFPLDSSDINYSMYLDVDNNFSTGACEYPSDGAEFVAVLDLSDTENPTAELLSFDSVTNTFVIVPDGIYDYGINIVGNLFFFDIDLVTIGNPTGKVSAWCVADSAGQIIDILPSCPAVKALTIPIIHSSGNIPPTVAQHIPSKFQQDVDRNEPIVVEFSESMDRASVESAFAISPTISLSFAWQGNSLIATPLDSLQPGQTYTVTLPPVMIDRGGLQLEGNADGLPGGPFIWEFRTEELPLGVFDEFAAAQDVFYEGQQISVAGTGFPPSATFDVYLVSNNPSTFDTSNVLTDVTDIGPTLSASDGFGILTLTPVGAILIEGEYNIIADLNSNGLYDSTIDRVDRVNIGFTVDPDCNGNLIPDGVELKEGLAFDLDHDGVLDVCDGCCVIAGDFNNDGLFNIADVTSGIARIFLGGPAPSCLDEADADGNNTFNIADVTFDIARIFSGGPAPICGTTGT